MRSSRLLFAVVAVVVTAVAGCGSSASSRPADGPSASAGGSSARAGSTSARAGGTVATGEPAAIPAPARQLGIDIDFYTYPGYDVATAAATDVAYVKSLGANALSVSFPFFVSGPLARSVYGNSATPSPAQLAVIAQDARKAGLYFSIRPLLDQRYLKKGGRVYWQPVDLAALFASYEQFLGPYAQMAQRYHIPEFITGAEFDEFYNSPYWTQLDNYLRRYYHGTLAYSNNWRVQFARRVNAAGVVQLLDAYPIIKLPDTASLQMLTASWAAYLGSYPRGTVLSEVSISAKSGAYQSPYQVSPVSQPLMPTIQQRWFTASCDAVAAEHDGGIYFWVLNIGQPLNVPPNSSDPSDWVDGPGAAAIAACFKHLG